MDCRKELRTKEGKRAANLARVALEHGTSELHTRRILRKFNIGLKLSKSKDGKIFGVTLIDHQTRCVFKVSDLHGISAAEFEKARAEGAEYVVFHVSDCADEELFTLKYRHTSQEIVEASIDLLNRLFPEPDGDLILLLENLWHPGLTLTEPEVTRRLLSGVHYRNKGILLDTGHLMHTDLSLRTQEEALKYLYRRVEEQGEEVRKAIRGIHLHQSLTGAYMAAVAAHPPILFIDPIKRMEQVYTHAFTCDQHRPFTCPGVREFIRWIDPEYLTLEFISSSRMEQETMLKEQLASLEKP